MKKYKIFFLPLIVIFLGGWISKDDAFKHLPVGTSVSNPFKFGMVQIPLPPGNWIVAGREVSETRATGAAFTIGGTMGTLFLLDVNGQNANGMIYIHTTLEYPRGNWNKPNDCSRTNILLAKEENSPQVYSYYCWTLNHNKLTLDPTTEALKEVSQFIREKSIKIPGNSLVATFFLAAGSKYLRASYHRNPDADGISPSSSIEWNTSDWHVSRIHQFPDKQQYAEKMKAWALGWKEKVKEGFDSK